ncbi:MAG: glycosyltransferase family 4 protein [Rubripirellula sp.]
MSDQPSVLFVTQYYVPEIGAPQARIHELAQRLQREGVRITILTAYPNYPSGVIQAGYTQRLFSRETIDGINICRVPIYATKSSGLIKRLTNYFSFVLTSMLGGLFRIGRHDIVIVESPPLFLGLSGWIISLFKRSRFVMNISDLWPESVSRIGAMNNSFALKLAEILEVFLYRRAKTITGQSIGICRGVKEKKPNGQIALVPNGCDCELFGSEKANRSEIENLGWQNHFVVGYAGLIGLAQGIDLYVTVADMLRDDDRFRFLIAGDGPELETVRSRADSLGLTNIHFLGFRAKKDMPGLVASFQTTIIPLKHFIPGALPSKIYETMASDVPIVLAAEGDPKELVERANAGIVVDYQDPQAVVDAIVRLADDREFGQQLGTNGRKYVLDHHDRHRIADVMLRVLRATHDRDKSFFENDACATSWRKQS